MSKNMFGSLYRPELLPEQLELNDFVELVDENAQERTRRSVDRHIESAQNPKSTRGTQNLTTLGGVSRPLTPEEALEVDQRIASLRDRIKQSKARIRNLKTQIDNQATQEDGKEISFPVDITKRPMLKRAIKKVFGYKTNTITYSMYKEAAETLRQLHQNEAIGYLEDSNGETAEPQV